MRFPFVFVLCVMLLNPVQGWAMTAQAWQTQLSQQITLLKTLAPSVTFLGDVTVTGAGQSMVASVPMASGVQGQKKWTTPVLKLYPRLVGDLVTGLKFVPQGAVVIQGSKTDFQSHIEFQDADITLDRGLKLVLNKVVSTQTTQKLNNKVSVDRAMITYSGKSAKNISLVDIFMLLQQQMGKENMRADAALDGLTLTSEKLNLSAKTLQAQVQIEPIKDSEKALIRNAIKVEGLTDLSGDMKSQFIPQNIALIGSILNMPVSLIDQSVMMTPQQKQQAMVDADTTIKIDEIKFETPIGISLTGSGAMQPALNVPTGLVGRLTLQMAKLQETLTNLQQQVTGAPSNSQQNNGQRFMALMLLQAMGQQEQTVTNYALDLTPDGQILLNGQNMAGLVALMGRSGESPKAATTGVQ
jgi:hypothetical protein